MDKTLRRERARAYWDEHTLDELGPDAPEVDLEVKKPLSAMLSLRLDAEYMARLKGLARQQDTGVTTMARRLLKLALDDISQIQAHRDPAVSPATINVVGEGRIGRREDEPAYYCLSDAELDRISVLVARSVLDAVSKAIRSVPKVAPNTEPGLFNRLRELEAGRS